MGQPLDGKVIAFRLAAEGAAVVLNHSSSLQQADEIVAEIKQVGGKARPAQADMAQEADVRRLFDAIIQQFGRLDILVNNAGLMSPEHLVEVGGDEFDRIFLVGDYSTLFCHQEAAKRMTTGGRLVKISSPVIPSRYPSYGASLLSQSVCKQLFHLFLNELEPRKITFDMVSLGPKGIELVGQGTTEAEKQACAQIEAVGRLGRPEDIAAAVAMLVGVDAAD